MMYIYMLQPKLPSNRLFAVYMLVLSISTYCILIASTAIDVTVVDDVSRIHTLATMIATPLLWLLVLYSFVPRLRFLREITWFFMALVALPLILGLLDWAVGTTYFFVYRPGLFTNGYVPIRQVLNGRFSGFFYAIYITILNSLLVIPIAFFTFSKKLPERLRRAAGVLLVLSISVGFLYMPWLHIPLALRSMLTPIFAAAGAAWVVSSYNFFSPIELATKQVVDNVTIGLMVFDEQLFLMDANTFSTQLLSIDLALDRHVLALPQLLQRLLPQVENKAELLQLQAAIKLRPEHIYQQEIILQDGRSPEPTGTTQKTWLALNIRPIYDTNKLYIGSSCTVEDLTVERRTQAYITEAHQAIEQYAYNQALLNDITQAAISTFDFDQDLSSLAGRLANVFEADSCYITLGGESEKNLKPLVSYGFDEELIHSLKRQPDEPSLWREILFHKQAISIENILESSYLSPRVAQLLPVRGLLVLPMVADTQLLGILLIGYNQPRTFSPEEVKWGEQVARQLTLAISKSRLLASEREQRVMLEALQAAGQAITSTLDFEQVMDRILEEIARVVPYDTANFALVLNGEAHIVRRRGFEKINESTVDILATDYMVIDQVPTLKTMYDTKRPLLVSDTTHSDMWMQQIMGHVKSWIGVPLIVGDEPIAFLMLDKMEANFYRIQHKERLVAFASQSTLALQHAQLFTEIQRRVSELEALSSISAALRSSDTIQNILQAVLQAMVEVLSARVGVAFLIDEGQSTLTSQASFPPAFYPMGIHYLLGEGITGYVAQTGELHVATDLTKDVRRKYKPSEPRELDNLQSSIALPLISDDAILGVIHLGLDTVYEFAEDEIHTLKAMCNIVANGLQRIQVMQTLESRVASRTYDLEMANEQLQELDKLKSKFIADVSHELRTPIANLSIYINLLQNGDLEKRNHYISVLQQQANRLMNLVEATLGLSRLEIGKSKLQFKPVNFNNIVEDIVLGHQARAEAFGLHLATLLQPDLPMVMGNQIQLAQLITNLITNAINYNQVSGQIRVETTFVEDEAMVCLTVRDDGIGIEEAELPHLFDRFYRGQQTGQSNIPGTGLGLAIVKEVVVAHNGRIDVTSQINEGTTVSVFLPISQDSEIGLKSGAATLLSNEPPVALQMEEKE